MPAAPPPVDDGRNTPGIKDFVGGGGLPSFNLPKIPLWVILVIVCVVIPTLICCCICYCCCCRNKDDGNRRQGPPDEDPEGQRQAGGGIGDRLRSVLGGAGTFLV